jgi:hypothetical protein
MVLLDFIGIIVLIFVAFKIIAFVFYFIGFCLWAVIETCRKLGWQGWLIIFVSFLIYAQIQYMQHNEPRLEVKHE